MHGFGWDASAYVRSMLAAQGDGEQIGHILDGLAAFESHGEIADVARQARDLAQG